MTSLDFQDMQGFVRSSYAKHLPCAAYLLLRITEPESSQKWLNNIIEKITTAERKQEGSSLNIAFTATGLGKLGLNPKELATFSRPFHEGMTTDHRKQILGDVEEDDPKNWNWGNSGNPADILLLVFAVDEYMLAEQLKQRDEEIEASGGISKIIKPLSAGRQPDTKEHFGFLDGVGQPVIEGTGGKENQLERTGHATEIKAGEFILGYKNEMGVCDPVPAAGGMPEFGANGTYLVFRQLEQHVAAFWNFLNEATRRPDGTIDPEARERLGAKMIGRWKSGAPLTKYRDRDPYQGTTEVTEENDFEYGADDEKGLGCPIGSHIRRTNPRDSLPPDPKTALKSVKRHRIMRRGRSYGDRAKDPFVDDSEQRGLHFICLNSDIERQFEFIQQTWVNNKTFDGLYDEVDPLVGRHRSGDLFTVPGDPARTRVHDLSKFVSLKGGAYFFMPGIQALRYLASLKT